MKSEIDGLPIDIDYRAKMRDGSIIYVRCIASRMSMEGYGNGVIVAVETDFTEQNTLQDQLSAIIGSIIGGVSVVQMRNNMPQFLPVNQAHFEVLGYTREQFSAEVKIVFDVVQPDNRERSKSCSRIRKRSVCATPWSIVSCAVTDRSGAIPPSCSSWHNRADAALSRERYHTAPRGAEEGENSGRAAAGDHREHPRRRHATVYHDAGNVEVLFANDGFYGLYGYIKKTA